VRRYEFIEVERICYPVRLLCRVMEVSQSAYYDWRHQQSASEKAEEIELAKQVKECFFRHRRRYGTRRIARELKKKGIEIGRYKVRRLMREQGLVAVNPRAFRPRTTDSKHGLRISPNLLKDPENQPVSWGEVIVGDITYLPMIGGRWCYLAMWQDKLTRRIIGWAVMERMTAELVVKALQKALRQGLIKAGAIIHSDRGSQYVADDFRRLLAGSGLRQSMSGKGNCYDNAQAESFFSRFKTELVEDGIFEDVETARSETFSYIEGYYNRIRMHSSLEYKSPMEYEKELKTTENRRSRESFVSCST
jgi:transposase InsO family protein